MFTFLYDFDFLLVNLIFLEFGNFGDLGKCAVCVCVCVSLVFECLFRWGVLLSRVFFFLPAQPQNKPINMEYGGQGVGLGISSSPLIFVFRCCTPTCSEKQTRQSQHRNQTESAFRHTCRPNCSIEHKAHNQSVNQSIKQTNRRTQTNKQTNEWLQFDNLPEIHQWIREDVGGLCFYKTKVIWKIINRRSGESPTNSWTKSGNICLSVWNRMLFGLRLGVLLPFFIPTLRTGPVASSNSRSL